MTKVEDINIKEEQLKNSLKSLLLKEELALHQQLIKKLADEMQLSILECAAALSLLHQPDLVLDSDKVENDTVKVSKNVPPRQKFVRYRLDVGQKHSVSIDAIKVILVEVSGVDKKRIGRIDIRNYYSLVDLPEGMPADIFQLLAEEEINQRQLKIKRVKYQPRFYRRNKKN